jgi:hypothetical protein
MSKFNLWNANKTGFVLFPAIIFFLYSTYYIGKLIVFTEGTDVYCLWELLIKEILK